MKRQRKFALLTVGYMLLGPAVIRFDHTTFDPTKVQPFLEMLRATRAIDALEEWAW